MRRSDPTGEQLLAALAQAPGRLAELVADLDAEQLCRPPAQDQWSAVEVLAHLRACADVWGGCIAAIAVRHEPTLRAVNPRAFVTTTDYADLPFDTSLAAFSAQRRDLLALLRALPEGDWARTAVVTGAGRPLERTPLFYAQWLARHERPHLAQIGRLAVALRG